MDQGGMTRCWDEYDRQERYAFRVKGTQVSCVKFIWSMNCLAVGHRNGQVSFWNLDSGSRCVYQGSPATNGSSSCAWGYLSVADLLVLYSFVHTFLHGFILN